jgi:predicted GNAT family acetyltransferase
MRPLVDPGSAVAFFTLEPIDVPSDWQVMRVMVLDQMTCVKMARPEPAGLLVRLGEADVPEMLALTAATEPGPFLPETIRMGKYYGIRAEDGRLAAMAGQRMQTDAFIEVSAVCTDPAFRGRGYARALVAQVT